MEKTVTIDEVKQEVVIQAAPQTVPLAEYLVQKEQELAGLQTEIDEVSGEIEDCRATLLMKETRLEGLVNEAEGRALEIAQLALKKVDPVVDGGVG